MDAQKASSQVTVEVGPDSLAARNPHVGQQGTTGAVLRTTGQEREAIANRDLSLSASSSPSVRSTRRHTPSSSQFLDA